MRDKKRTIDELVMSAAGRFSACETQQDFLDQTRLYTELMTERIEELLSSEVERCARVAEEYIDNSEADDSVAISATVRTIASAIRARR